MMAMGIWEIVIVFGLLAGGGSVDIVSTLPAKEYLKARDIEVSAEKLMELAVQTPDSGKKQFSQLMALSHLAAEPELIAKSPKMAEYRKTLSDIAGGKKAADAEGFAAEYAQRVLRTLSGEKAPPRQRRAWKDSLTFLPEKADMVGYMDAGSGGASMQKSAAFAGLLDVMPKEVKEQMWSAMEKVGNVRLETLGFTASFSPDSGRLTEFVVRATGKGNPEWILPLLPELKELNDKQRRDADGQTIRIFSTGPNTPVIALVGNREVIIAGVPPEFPPAKKAGRTGDEIMEALLAARGKQKSPLTGPLKADLEKVPADANVVFVGNIPPEKGPTPFPLPGKVIAFGKPFAGGIDLQISGVMGNDESAKEFVSQVGKFRDMGLDELKKMQGKPLPFPAPGININGMIGLLESVQLEAVGNEAKVRALVPDEMMSMAMMGFIVPFQVRAAAPPPPVPQPAVEEKKVEDKKK
jgi:hypothetical protein